MDNGQLGVDHEVLSQVFKGVGKLWEMRTYLDPEYKVNINLSQALCAIKSPLEHKHALPAAIKDSLQKK